MILSVSRRTDIPNHYADWFLNRIRTGELYVKNPVNAKQIRRVDLSPEAVDCIVFWTKNPSGIIDRLDELHDYHYYFQFTLTGYGRDIEPGLPDKKKVLIPLFRKLADRIGKERVVWRYDPILFNGTYTMDYHLKTFEEMAKTLSPFTETCTVSFLQTDYKSTKRNAALLQSATPSTAQKETLLRQLAQIAAGYGITLETCAQAFDYRKLGIRPAKCIDAQRLERSGGYSLQIKKDPNQRPDCGCAASVDMGAYNTCKNGCLYCYANYNEPLVRKNFALHDPLSPLLIGRQDEKDVLHIRPAASQRSIQPRLSGCE